MSAPTPTQIAAQTRRQNFRLSIAAAHAKTLAGKREVPAPSSVVIMRRDKTHVSSGRAFPPEILVYPFIPEEPKTARPTIAEIQALIAKEFLISVGDLKSRRRERPVVWPRQIAMYLCKEATLFSLPVIGRHFGDRDHTTVLHACEKVGTTVRGSAAFALDIVILLEKLTGRAQ